MSQKLFTAAEIAELKKNPYVKSVSKRSIILASEFKELAYRKMCSGRTPQQIFRDCGFDVEVLGKTRIAGYTERIQKIGDGNCDFTDKRVNNCRKEPQSDIAKMAKRIRQLEHRAAYLEQENEFLKKIQALEEECSGKTVKPK